MWRKQKHNQIKYKQKQNNFNANRLTYFIAHIYKQTHSKATAEKAKKMKI